MSTSATAYQRTAKSRAALRTLVDDVRLAVDDKLGLQREWRSILYTDPKEAFRWALVDNYFEWVEEVVQEMKLP